MLELGQCETYSLRFDTGCWLARTPRTSPPPPSAWFGFPHTTVAGSLTESLEEGRVRMREGGQGGAVLLNDLASEGKWHHFR